MPAIEVSTIDREIGRRIWRARQGRMSQAKLGSAIGGLQVQAVRNMEAGRNKVSIERLLKIAAVLGQPLSFFLEGFGPEADLPAAMSAEAIGIARAIDMTTDPEQRKKLLDLCAVFTTSNLQTRIRAA